MYVPFKAWKSLFSILPKWQNHTDPLWLLMVMGLHPRQQLAGLKPTAESVLVQIRLELVLKNNLCLL